MFKHATSVIDHQIQIFWCIEENTMPSKWFVLVLFSVLIVYSFWKVKCRELYVTCDEENTACLQSESKTKEQCASQLASCTRRLKGGKKSAEKEEWGK